MTDDYDNNAALVDELDLVISVPQAVVHLAGALGKRCLCIVPDVHRWIYEGDRHTWYESVELLHGWDTVIDQVKERIGNNQRRLSSIKSQAA
jgi:ADP-heptose:LPS heptosyltransferase